MLYYRKIILGVILITAGVLLSYASMATDYVTGLFFDYPTIHIHHEWCFGCQNIVVSNDYLDEEYQSNIIKLISVRLVGLWVGMLFLIMGVELFVGVITSTKGKSGQNSVTLPYSLRIL